MRMNGDPDEPATGFLKALAGVLAVVAACMVGVVVAVWMLR